MKVSIEDIKRLREETGAGVMDCKEALLKAGGDIGKAVIHLREKGIAAMEKREGRVPGEGVIYSYVHHGNRVGALVEVNCETDFVSKTDDFMKLVKDIAVQIVTMKPEYISREHIPAEEMERIKGAFSDEARKRGKPENIVERIVEGKANKFFERICLLDQTFVWDEERKVRDLILEFSSKVGEKIAVRRFVRFEVGK